MVVREEIPGYKFLPSEVPRKRTHPQFVADGDHGQLHLGGEHNVGHGGGDVLGSALEHLVDDGTDTKTLTREDE